MKDDPRNLLERILFTYSKSAWMNIPITILAMPFLIGWVLLRGLWLSLRPVRPQQSKDWSVVCLSHVFWHHVWQRNHHTMTWLARRGHKVLYLVPVYLHVVARWPCGLMRWQANPFPPDVTVYYPPMLPGGSRLKWIERLNRWLLAAEARGRGFHPPLVLWFYYPAHESLRHALDHKACLYDIQDEYSAFPWSSKTIAASEKRLLDSCDLTFPGTYALYESKRPASGHSFFFACGVDVEHFSRRPDSVIEGQRNPDGSSRPRLGYFGAIDSRIDALLLERMCDAHPEWDVVMIGPVQKQQFTMPQRSNLLFAGQASYTDLPAWIHGWDVALMPWMVNELTLHINPTKTLEYFAARKPVVSIALPDIEKFYSDVIYLARSHEEFIGQCERALANRGQDDARLDAAFVMAQAQSWESVVSQMESHIQDAIQRRKSGQ